MDGCVCVFRFSWPNFYTEYIPNTNARQICICMRLDIWISFPRFVSSFVEVCRSVQFLQPAVHEICCMFWFSLGRSLQFWNHAGNSPASTEFTGGGQLGEWSCRVLGDSPDNDWWSLQKYIPYRMFTSSSAVGPQFGWCSIYMNIIEYYIYMIIYAYYIIYI